MHKNTKLVPGLVVQFNSEFPNPAFRGCFCEIEKLVGKDHAQGFVLVPGYHATQVVTLKTNPSMARRAYVRFHRDHAEAVGIAPLDASITEPAMKEE